jgi:hypothetical protein
MKKELICSTHYLKAEEVVKQAEVLDGELSAKTISELSKKSFVAGCHDDVVDIEQQVSCIRTPSKDEQGGVGACRAKAKLMKKCHHALVPGAWCLLQSVQGAGEQTHTVGMLGIDEPGGLLPVHLFREMAMKEGVGDVNLVHRPSSGGGKVQNSLDRAWFDNQSERIREVDAGALAEASDHPVRLVALSVPLERSLCLNTHLPVMTLARGGLMTHKYRGSQQSSREVKPKFIDSTQGEPKNIYKP